MQRASVDLPQPVSPTRPRVSPPRISSGDAVDGVHHVRAAPQVSGLNGEVLDDVRRRQQDVVAHRRYRLADYSGP